ncbi:MAG TPA: iron ABC transporter permease [Hyphomonadaceae bacterium]|nr:iron ABC transporter permease [Ponticaulis sp.]HBJ91857.1 iron ABC transporter permease [Hyphomonadaceae bacterium]
MNASKSIAIRPPSQTQNHLRRVALASLVFLIAALLTLPLFGVIIGSLGESDGTWSHLSETVLSEYVINTLALLLMVGVLTGSIGTVSAWLVTSIEFPGRKVVEWLLVLPIASPAYIASYVYTDLMDYAGPVQSALRGLMGWGADDYWFPAIRTLPGAGLVLSFVLYPYVYLLARSAFLNQSQTRFAAARSLGASPLRAFWSVALPAARAAILGGIALTLMETAADFGVADYFGVPTFSTGIYRAWYGMGDPVSALRLSGLLLVIMAILVMAERRFRPSQANNDIARDTVLRRMKPSRPLQWLAAFACIMPILIGFAFPVARLIYLAAGDIARNGMPQFVSFATNSVTMSVIAAGLTLALSLFLAYAQRGRTRNQKTGPMSAATRLATLGYALPGTLLAVGLLLPMTTIDKSISRWMLDQFGWAPGLFLTGTVVTLIYAYVIRFLTVSYNTVEPAVSSIPRAMDEAARTLGSRLSRIVFEVHLPGLKPALYSAGLLVFIDTMRELPATLLLRPANFETLATQVYRLASDERLAEASVAALILIAIGILPVMLITRANLKS